MRQLHRAFERARARLGVPAEGRAYHPHVTLGRVPPEQATRVNDALSPLLANTEFSAQATLPSVDLMRSELTPSGSRYTVLSAAPLGAGHRTPAPEER